MGAQIAEFSTTICEWAKQQKYNIAIGSSYTKLDKKVAREFGFVDTAVESDSDRCVTIPEDISLVDKGILEARKQLLGSKYQHIVFHKVINTSEHATRVVGSVYSDAKNRRFTLKKNK